MNTGKTILITNDDGYLAQGIQALTQVMQKIANVVVVAPDSARSGAGCSITPTQPVNIQEIAPNTYACSGTPVDCVKIALEKILPNKPDLVVSGVNHGDNASISLHYSGTVGAVLEACMKGIPAIAYSLRTTKKNCDFTPYTETVEKWAQEVLNNGLPQDTCLNINFPETSKLSGERICRMARGLWHTEWIDSYNNSNDKKTYTLTGTFCNLEPDATDTDYWAIDNNMAAITPLSLDMTCYDLINRLKLGE